MLAEKRTYYALLRTGMAVVTVPLSLILFLIATAKYHNLFNHWWLATLVMVGLVAASVGGVVVLNQARWKLRKIERMIRGIKHDNQRMSEIIV